MITVTYGCNQFSQYYIQLCTVVPKATISRHNNRLKKTEFDIHDSFIAKSVFLPFNYLVTFLDFSIAASASVWVKNANIKKCNLPGIPKLDFFWCVCSFCVKLFSVSCWRVGLSLTFSQVWNKKDIIIYRIFVMPNWYRTTFFACKCMLKVEISARSIFFNKSS